MIIGKIIHAEGKCKNRKKSIDVWTFIQDHGDASFSITNQLYHKSQYRV